jgi:non-canonical purine NTP pyrophosphatase (RdgB/HAM1 family)
MKKERKIVFITGNANKAKYLSDYFHIPVDHQKLDLQEIQSLSGREVVEDKARRAFAEVGKPVLVEDVSLVFHALGELPGPLIKWFLHSLGNDGMCRLLDGYEDRRATASVEFAYCNGVEVRLFKGEIRGIVPKYPRGSTNFGWDPIFIPDGYEKTWAEMTGDEKHETSMRKIALEKLAEFLEGK